MMTLNSLLPLLYPLVVGVALGAFFFGGLWWTIRRGLTSERVALWFLVSWFMRTGIVVAGFYFISDGQWQRLLASLIGFIIGRVLVSALTKRSCQKVSGETTTENVATRPIAEQLTQKDANRAS